MVSLDQTSNMENFNTDLYFKALLAVGKSDGILDEGELEFLRDQAHVLSFNLDDLLDQDYDIKNLAKENYSTFTKNLIIKDCISLAFSDGKYDEKERSKIQELGEILDIRETKIADIENWLKEYWEILEKGEILLNS